MNIGSFGEKVAQEFLENKGYRFISRNYRKPWGEIDLVFEKEGMFLFVEVKTVESPYHQWLSVKKHRRPEERVTREKLAKLRRVVESYILERGIECEWVFAVCGVLLDVNLKRAEVSLLFEPL